MNREGSRKKRKGNEWGIQPPRVLEGMEPQMHSPQVGACGLATSANLKNNGDCNSIIHLVPSTCCVHQQQKGPDNS